MEKRTAIKTVTVDLRGSQKVVTINVPRNAKRITGVIVTSKLSGNAMNVYSHYVGAIADPGEGNYNDAFVQTLTKSLLESTVKVFSVNAGVGKKIFYARPSVLDGQPVFEVNGVSAIVELLAEGVAVEDSETGSIQNYDIYATQDTNLGSVNFAVL